MHILYKIKLFYIKPNCKKYSNKIQGKRNRSAKTRGTSRKQIKMGEPNSNISIIMLNLN